MRQLFLYACAVLALLAAILIITSHPATPEEAQRMLDEDEGTFMSQLFSREHRECAYRGECYSWGGRVQEWHKAFAPVLVVLAFLTIVVFVKRLPK